MMGFMSMVNTDVAPPPGFMVGVAGRLGGEGYSGVTNIS